MPALLHAGYSMKLQVTTKIIINKKTQTLYTKRRNLIILKRLNSFSLTMHKYKKAKLKSVNFFGSYNTTHT